jgi:hypothetical protein
LGKREIAAFVRHGDTLCAAAGACSLRSISACL